ncbi:ATP-binding protein [Desulfobacterota bacterium M19]
MLRQCFDEFAELSACACFLISPAGIILRSNALAAQMLGQSGDLLTGRNITQLTTTPVEIVSHYLKRCLQSREPVPGALCWQTGMPGHGIDCYCHGHRLFTCPEEKEPVVLLHCQFRERAAKSFAALNQTLENLRVSYRKLIDKSNQLTGEILEREEVQKKLAESHERLMTVLDGLDAVVYVADMRTYELMFLNKYAIDTLGITDSGVGRICWQTLQKDQSGPCSFCTNQRIVDAEGNPADVYRWEFQNTQNGCWYDIRDRAIRWIDGRIVRMEIATDITKRKKSEQVLEQKNAELENFTYAISHDLKSPIITIKGFLGSLVSDARTGDFERMEADVKRIARAADKMQVLLDDVLELSRIGRLVNPAAELSITEAANEAIEDLAAFIREKNAVVTVEADMPPVFVDCHRIREVMQNLIENAVKYSCNQAEPRIEVGCKVLADGQYTYFVKDNGIGIEPKFYDKIFGLFEKLDPHSAGTGIGLALVKRIIELHGGKIWVESTGSDQGTIFYFTLPQQQTVQGD